MVSLFLLEGRELNFANLVIFLFRLQKQPSKRFLGKDVLKIYSKFTRLQIYKRSPMPKCHLNKVALQHMWTPTQVFSCEYCKIFKNSFLHKTSLVAASGPVKNLWWRFFIYVTIQKMKFSIKDFFSKCDQICRKLRMATFTEENLNRKLHFLCSMFDRVLNLPLWCLRNLTFIGFNPFFPMRPFSTSWKHQKTLRFSDVSMGVIEKVKKG